MHSVTDFRKLRKAEKQAILDENRGFLNRVAEATGHEASVVSRVFWGHVKKSPKIVQAIQNQIARVKSAEGQQANG